MMNVYGMIARRRSHYEGIRRLADDRGNLIVRMAETATLLMAAWFAMAEEGLR